MVYIFLLPLCGLLMLQLASGGADCRCRACDLAYPTGPYCDMNVDFCAVNPCQHGGKCINTATTFRCECTTSYFGDVCQNPYLPPTFLNSPSDLPAMVYAVPNHTLPFPILSVYPLHGQPPISYQWYIDGWALDGEDDPQFNITLHDIQYNPSSTVWVVATDIRGNWAESTHCVINPYCTRPGTCFCNTPCVFGSCLDNNICNCTGTLHYGTRCEIANNCNVGTYPVYCNTTGTKSCKSNKGVVTCTCNYGFQGTRCDVGVDQCLTSPCANGGTCVNGFGSYTCYCALHWAGTTCTADEDECATGRNECSKNGTLSCTDQKAKKGYYTCNCIQGWTGTYCQTNINECASAPCPVGKTCVDGVNSYTCI